MIFIGLAFLFGVGSFIAGLHYSHIKIVNNKEYPDYYKAIIISRDLSVIFFVIGFLVLLLL